MEVSASPDFSVIAACVPVKTEGQETQVCAQLSIPDGVQPLWFRFTGEGRLDFYSFELR